MFFREIIKLNFKIYFGFSSFQIWHSLCLETTSTVVFPLSLNLFCFDASVVKRSID